MLTELESLCAQGVSGNTSSCKVTPVILHGVVSGHPTRGCIRSSYAGLYPQGVRGAGSSVDGSGEDEGWKVQERAKSGGFNVQDSHAAQGHAAAWMRSTLRSRCIPSHEPAIFRGGAATFERWGPD